MILVDTNIPLRLIQPAHLHHQAAIDSLSLLRTRDSEEFLIAPQSLYEMYVVCTRPTAQHGLGLTPPQASVEITKARTLFRLLPETSGVFLIWAGLVSKYSVSGKTAHDTRLVAMMVEHRVNRILTFNDSDFKRYGEVTPINPFDILGLPRI